MPGETQRAGSLHDVACQSPRGNMRFEAARAELARKPKRWLVTGVAGFIGSNLLQSLLELGQSVVGLDNFSTGHRRNLEDVRAQVSDEAWQAFRFIEGDIRSLTTCRKACEGVDVVLHQAAIGSVPRSIENPRTAHDNNLTGFLNMLVAAKEHGIGRFVYASSSSVYGDHPGLPKIEEAAGAVLSPYAATKRLNEVYAEAFARSYGLKAIGLRYFNIFGPRQDPEGAYAAVIPRWFAALIHGEAAHINGDGETSRDFCFIENCVQANILAACADAPEALGQVYNIAYGERTSLNELFALIRELVARRFPRAADARPEYRDFRAGDVRHSLANLDKAGTLLGYAPRFSVRDGLERAADWYVRHMA